MNEKDRDGCLCDAEMRLLLIKHDRISDVCYWFWFQHEGVETAAGHAHVVMAARKIGVVCVSLDQSLLASSQETTKGSALFTVAWERSIHFEENVHPNHMPRCDEAGDDAPRVSSFQKRKRSFQHDVDEKSHASVS